MTKLFRAAKEALEKGILPGFVVKGRTPVANMSDIQKRLIGQRLSTGKGNANSMRDFTLKFERHPSGSICCTTNEGVRIYGTFDTGEFDTTMNKHITETSISEVRRAQPEELTPFGGVGAVTVDEPSDAELRAMGFSA